MFSNRLPVDKKLAKEFKIKIITEIRALVLDKQMQSQLPGILILIDNAKAAKQKNILQGLSRNERLTTAEMGIATQQLSEISGLNVLKNAEFILTKLHSKFAFQFQFHTNLDQLRDSVRDSADDQTIQAHLGLLLSFAKPNGLQHEQINNEHINTAFNFLVSVFQMALADPGTAILKILRANTDMQIENPALKNSVKQIVDKFGLDRMPLFTNVLAKEAAQKSAEIAQPVILTETKPIRSKAIYPRTTPPRPKAASNTNTKVTDITAEVLPPAAFERALSKENDAKQPFLPADTKSASEAYDNAIKSKVTAPVSTLTLAPVKLATTPPLPFFQRARNSLSLAKHKVMATLCCVPAFDESKLKVLTTEEVGSGPSYQKIK